MSGFNDLKTKLEKYSEDLTSRVLQENYKTRLIIGLIGLIIPATLALTYASVKKSNLVLYSGLLGISIVILLPTIFISNIFFVLPTIIFSVANFVYFILWIFGIIELIKFADANKIKISKNM